MNELRPSVPLFDFEPDVEKHALFDLPSPPPHPLEDPLSLLLIALAGFAAFMIVHDFYVSTFGVV